MDSTILKQKDQVITKFMFFDNKKTKGCLKKIHIDFYD